jgi:hypothetical protein
MMEAGAEEPPAGGSTAAVLIGVRTVGCEGTAATAGCDLPVPDGVTAVLRMDVVVSRVLSRAPSAGFTSGVWAAQEKNVTSATTGMIPHIKFFICFILLVKRFIILPLKSAYRRR